MTQAPEMTFEVGKTYRRKDGSTDKIVANDKSDRPFRGESGYWYRLDGITLLSQYDLLPGAIEDEAPTIDLTKITEPCGLLDDATREALIAHGGPYEYFTGYGWREEALAPDDLLEHFTYRVKPGPKVETVTQDLFADDDGFLWPGDSFGAPFRVTFNRIDGKPDLSSYKLEKR